MDTGHVGRLPSGLSICCSIPDMLYLPELVFGGLVWILVACTYIDPYNPQAYVMDRVSVLLRHHLHLDDGLRLWIP
ncbi:hypothetical protein AOLI_G00329830 [Acnodon oligacanthus]